MKWQFALHVIKVASKLIEIDRNIYKKYKRTKLQAAKHREKWTFKLTYVLTHWHFKTTHKWAREQKSRLEFFFKAGEKIN